MKRTAEALLRKALAQASVPPFESDEVRTILIIDGMDKCVDQEEVPDLLHFLLDLILEFPRLYVFLTTRPRPSIMYTLSDVRFSDKIRYRQLGNGWKEWAENAKQYTKIILLNIPCHGDYLRDRTRTLHRLVKYAQDDFTVASAMAGFLSVEHDFPGDQLDDFFGTESTISTRQDTVYMSILRFAFVNHQSPSEQLKLLTLLQFIAIYGDTLTPSIIASCAPHLSVNDIISIADRLRSILTISTKGEVVLLHPSFRDFLLDRHRCRDSRFLVNRHTHLTSVCLTAISNATPITAVLMRDPLPTVELSQQLRYPLLTLWPRFLAKARDSDVISDQLQFLIPSPQLAMYAWLIDEAHAMIAGAALMRYTKQLQGDIETIMSHKCAQFLEFISYVQLWRDLLLRGGSQTITGADLLPKIIQTCTMESVPLHMTRATKDCLSLRIDIDSDAPYQIDVRCKSNDLLFEYQAIMVQFTDQLQIRPDFLEEAVFVELSIGTYRIDRLDSI
ncbi:hypothetical protein PsYK624_104320 [Phanerochaete sordida]|uniref:NACHT domain-containing protein n=1 Tax=Phanerochaete sordida TaxID=48140 RepID=A0A9P3GDU6_9APHY|nr:hypothetical protein PsYK624_104320 [Phanerochaete sordida]